MLTKLYKFFDITEKTDLSLLRHEDFPILSDLYEYIDEEYKHFTENRNNIYTRETLREILLLLNSICVGSDSKFFNGHTNIGAVSYTHLSFVFSKTTCGTGREGGNE